MPRRTAYLSVVACARGLRRQRVSPLTTPLVCGPSNGCSLWGRHFRPHRNTVSQVEGTVGQTDDIRPRNPTRAARNWRNCPLFFDSLRQFFDSFAIVSHGKCRAKSITTIVCDSFARVYVYEKTIEGDEEKISSIYARGNYRKLSNPLFFLLKTIDQTIAKLSITIASCSWYLMHA